MLKILLPVDGSASATRATEKVIETIGWYKEPPEIDLLAVHLAVPRYPNMSKVVRGRSSATTMTNRRRCWRKQEALDAAENQYRAHTLVGPIAESIVEQAKQSGSDMIYMGTRGSARSRTWCWGR